MNTFWRREDFHFGSGKSEISVKYPIREICSLRHREAEVIHLEIIRIHMVHETTQMMRLLMVKVCTEKIKVSFFFGWEDEQ